MSKQNVATKDRGSKKHDQAPESGTHRAASSPRASAYGASLFITRTERMVQAAQELGRREREGKSLQGSTETAAPKSGSRIKAGRAS